MCSVLRVQAPPASTNEEFDKYMSKKERHEDSLTNFVQEGCVAVGIELGKKELLFEHFARTFAEALPDLDQKVILEALWERERTQNTALGHGLALPHATLAVAQTTHLGIFITAAAIDCDAPDQLDVDAFFVTLGPPSERNTHLQLLGALSRLVLKTDILQRLRAATAPEQVLVAITEAEASLRED